MVADSGSGRQRPPRKRADARRNEATLLDAAAAAFVASGVDVPVRDIAARAGVGVGTIYRHFPTRADLIVAVYRHQVEACAEAGPALLASSAHAARRAGAMDRPLRRLPGHQARPRRGAAVRRRRLRDAARLLPRPPRARVRRNCSTPRPRRARSAPAWTPRTDARRRQSLRRRGQRPPLRRAPPGRTRHRGLRPAETRPPVEDFWWDFRPSPGPPGRCRVSGVSSAARVSHRGPAGPGVCAAAAGGVPPDAGGAGAGDWGHRTGGRCGLAGVPAAGGGLRGCGRDCRDTRLAHAEDTAMRKAAGACLSGAVALGLYVRWVRPHVFSWGATSDEASGPIAGDELCPRPQLNATRAVTVAAGPEDIWPWLVQWGWNRAGFYSYDLLDDLGQPQRPADPAAVPAPCRRRLGAHGRQDDPRTPPTGSPSSNPAR